MTRHLAGRLSAFAVIALVLLSGCGASEGRAPEEPGSDRVPAESGAGDTTIGEAHSSAAHASAGAVDGEFPTALIIGDSMATSSDPRHNGYAFYVREDLRGRVDVYFNENFEEYFRFTTPTSRDVNKQLDLFLSTAEFDREYDVVFVHVGSWDILLSDRTITRDRIDSHAHGKNVASIVNKLIANPKVGSVIYGTITPINPHRMYDNVSFKVSDYNAESRKRLEVANVRILDLQRIFFEEGLEYSSPRNIVHLSQESSRRMAKHIGDAIWEEIEKLRDSPRLR